MATGGLGNQREVSAVATGLKEYEEDSELLEDSVSDDDSNTTKQVLYNFVFTRAEHDTNLTTEQKDSFQQAQSSTDNQTVSSTASRNAHLVGRRLAQLGDEIDALYLEQFEDIVDVYDNPQEAFRSFNHVLQNVFNWEDGELPTLGHIAAVLGYCYHLCKYHVQKYLVGSSSTNLLSLLGLLAGFLVRFFFKSKVYEWIANQGGWGRLMPSQSLFPSWNNYYFLIISAVSLTAFLYFRFRGK